MWLCLNPAASGWRWPGKLGGGLPAWGGLDCISLSGPKTPATAHCGAIVAHLVQSRSCLGSITAALWRLTGLRVAQVLPAATTLTTNANGSWVSRLTAKVNNILTNGKDNSTALLLHAAKIAERAGLQQCQGPAACPWDI